MKLLFGILLLLPSIFHSTNCFGQAANNQKNLELLIKDSIIREQISLTDTSFTLYKSSTKDTVINTLNSSDLQYLYFLKDGQSSHQANSTPLNWLAQHIKKVAVPPCTDSSLVLKGIKIAIDPGHLAYDMDLAKIEGKYIELTDTLDQPQSFYEAHLTLCTSKILKRQLEELGAAVIITREDSSYHKNTFYDWYKNDCYKSIDSLYAINEIDNKEKAYLRRLRRKNSDLAQKILFNRVFKQIDYNKRAQIINDFEPHLTLVIHYNVDSENKNWSQTTQKNYCMAFVPGSFMEGELSDSLDQLEFQRLLFSNDIMNSIEFSTHIISAMNKILNVPIAEPQSADYFDKYSITTGINGVYARNLALTRKIHGTICYGESLYQDNSQECILLSKKNLLIDNLPCNDRVYQVAQAYLSGILSYINYKRLGDD